MGPPHPSQRVGRDASATGVREVRATRVRQFSSPQPRGSGPETGAAAERRVRPWHPMPRACPTTCSRTRVRARARAGRAAGRCRVRGRGAGRMGRGLQRAPAAPEHTRSWFARVVRAPRDRPPARSKAPGGARAGGARPERVRLDARCRGARRDGPAARGGGARLEEPFRSAVLLRFLDGLPPRAVAARLGVPVGDRAQPRAPRARAPAAVLEEARGPVLAARPRRARRARARLGHGGAARWGASR